MFTVYWIVSPLAGSGGSQWMVTEESPTVTSVMLTGPGTVAGKKGGKYHVCR